LFLLIQTLTTACDIDVESFDIFVSFGQDLWNIPGGTQEAAARSQMLEVNLMPGN
jgi:hypothetical protein